MKKELKAIICSLNSQYIHSSLAPWCLLAGVEEYCNDSIFAEVVEGTINEAPLDVLKRILSYDPDVVGFCCYIWNITSVFGLVQMVKEKLPSCVIVLGGPEVSYNAGEILQTNSLVDYVISGEGEKPLAELFNMIDHGSQVEGVSGLCYRKGEEIVISKPHTPCEIPPSPYSKQYFAALNGRIAYLESSRGCPYSCAFCLSGRCGGVRYYDLERAKQEILLLANSGTQTIKLVDRTFNANRKRANQLFQFIIDHYGKDIPLGICFHFEIAGDLLDAETIELLSAAPIGSMQFEIGLQSFNSTTLAKINRKTDMEKLKKNISALITNGNAHIHIDLIAGLPHEDMDSFILSFNTAFALKPEMLQLGFLKLLHGSPMREAPEQFPCEFDHNAPYEVEETPWISVSELKLLHHTDRALDQLHNRGRFRRTITYLLSHLEKSPFTLFCDFGVFFYREGELSHSLDDFTALVFTYFASQPGVDQIALRDCMVCDRLATNASGKLPKVLQIADPRLKTAIKALEREHERKKAVKRGYALLYGENCLVYVDYVDKNPVTGEYTLNKYPAII
jgi:radical SAM superfamily enzyme YgiQ (UPF0313 family)